MRRIIQIALERHERVTVGVSEATMTRMPDTRWR